MEVKLKFLLVASALLLCACVRSESDPSALNQPAGKYRDYADYLIDKDPSVQAEISRRNASPELAHCATEKLGWLVFQGRYPELSDAVSGRKPMTVEEEWWANNQFQMTDPQTKQKMVDDSWAACGA
jgi:hypothetical protein